MARDSVAGVSFLDLSAGGRVGELIRTKDWAATPLGPKNAWPRSLHNHLSMIFELPTAAIIFWGPEQIQLYNDGYAVIMGPRHPRHLGSTFAACWPEAYSTMHPWMRRVLDNGETVEVIRTLVPLTRFGFTEEAYFTFSFSPLRDDEGRIAGILQLVTEVTQTVLGERRAAALYELSNQTAQAKTVPDATRLAVEVLRQHADDIPFCLFYVTDPAGRSTLILSGSTGPPGNGSFPAEIDLHAEAAASALPEFALAVGERRPIRIENVATRFGGPPADAWPESSTLAIVSPILAADQQSVVAVLVAGISPRLTFDGSYQGFLQLVCAQLATLMAAARAYDDEQRRADGLAAVDRAKTEFFSNVSHEFRTPLTLILGLVEDAIAQRRSLAGADLDVVHRSGVRLLRLVNSLLDFTRIEAGRLKLSYEPTDLSTLTIELASAFCSLVERAGLRLVVRCPPLPEPVYVDRLQWEKIVLNLISNAFKFTFEGEIEVVMTWQGDGVELRVRDTGTGIPAHELPHIFDRFHRVEQARGRSFEGTGIGLALVQELVKLHGGQVDATSTEGKGSTFTVTIPAGADHLPAGQIVHGHEMTRTFAKASSHVVEASQWARPHGSNARRPDMPAETPTVGMAPEPGRILLVDDNPDMREYLSRLLRARWEVEEAGDGLAALASARAHPPDLILSDVMMPRLDGFGLLRELRSDSRTHTVPVILLSARAGEEAVLEGLEYGADDYLAKPFTTQELLARVRTHLGMARTRNQLISELGRTNQELEAFSYSVAHDLRGPLSSIGGFTQLLLIRYGSTLDATAREYLECTDQATGMMNQMIDDLLMLARVGRAELQRAQVDLSAWAGKVVNALRERDPERQIEVDIARGLTAQADPGLLRIVLDNLIGNAWKYTGRQPVPRIEVGACAGEDGTVYFVRDNGAGFDMQHAGKLFTAFVRMHSESQFPGTGIGLATVQRIVQRHGGRIWAEAAVDLGAAFYFTLP